MPQILTISNQTRITIWITVEGFHSGRIYYRSEAVTPGADCTIVKRGLLWSPCELKAYGSQDLSDFLCRIGEEDYQAHHLLFEYKDPVLLEENENGDLLTLQLNLNSHRAISAIGAISPGLPAQRLQRINSEIAQPGYRFRESPSGRPIAILIRDKPVNVVKTGFLSKQGAVIKTWHRRFFVLSEIGINYYEDSVSWKEGHTPLGQLLFEDLVLPSGNVVDEIPKLMFAWIGKKYCFCVHVPERTLVMSAQSQAIKTEWMNAIGEQYTKFVEKQSKRVALLQFEKELGEGKPLGGRRRGITHYDKNKPPKDFEETFEDVQKKLRTDYEMKMRSLRQIYDSQRAFLIWKMSVPSRRVEKLVL